MTPILWHDLPWDVSAQSFDQRHWRRRIHPRIWHWTVTGLIGLAVEVGIALVAWWGISAVWRML